MAASDAIPVPRKNVAYRFSFAIRKPSDSTLITTWTGQDSEVSKDGAAYSDCTNEATEIGTSGTGYIDLTADEMNCDCLLLKITVTNTGAVPLVFTIFPEEVGDYRCNTVQVGGTTQTALDISATATAILNRIGAFSVSSSNTIFGFFLALLRKDATLPGDIGGTYAVGTDSLEAQQEAAAAVSARIPSALVSGRMDSYVGAMATDSITATALSSGAVAEIAASATVLPIVGSVVSSVSGTTITVYVGSQTAVTISTNEDLSAKTMVVAIEDRAGTDIATIVDGSITKTSTTVTFTIPSTATTLVRDLHWSLRDTTTQTPYLFGVLQVSYAAKADA